MKISPIHVRIASGIWLLMSLTLIDSILMEPTDESPRIKIQAICFFTAGFVGFIPSLILLFQPKWASVILQKWASVILRILSWVYATYYLGFSVYGIIVSISLITSGNILHAIFLFFMNFIFILLAVVFIFLAYYLKQISLYLSKSKEA